MTDIVERLRDQGKDAFARKYSLGMFKLCTEAADEIEQLRLEHKHACQEIAIAKAEALPAPAQAPSHALAAPPSVALEAGLPIEVRLRAVRATAIEECAGVADAFVEHEQTIIDGNEPESRASYAAGTRQVAAEQIAHDIRALTRPQPGGAVAGTERGGIE